MSASTYPAVVLNRFNDPILAPPPQLARGANSQRVLYHCYSSYYHGSAHTVSRRT